MYKAYKFRLYPDEFQRVLIEKTFGCCRFIYNYALSYKIKRYEEGDILSFYELRNEVIKIKKDNKFLTEVDSMALQSSIENVDKAFKNFYRGSGYPKFKTKYGRRSFTTKLIRNNIRIDFQKREIRLPKIGFVKIKGYRKRQKIEQIKEATVTKDGNRYYVVVVVKAKEVELCSVNSVVGVDVGVKNITLSTGESVIPNSLELRKEKKVRRTQKSLSRKMTGGSSWKKEKDKLARKRLELSNSRKYRNIAVTKKVVQYDLIVIEDLSVSTMINAKSNSLYKHRFNNSISNASMSTLLTRIENKARLDGKRIIRVSRFYPSSQTCSRCGEKNKQMRNLSKRRIKCGCGADIDRDLNAAINLMYEGTKLFFEYN